MSLLDLLALGPNDCSNIYDRLCAYEFFDIFGIYRYAHYEGLTQYVTHIV